MSINLSTDAAAGDEDNPGGFGAVLTQQWADGLEHVIAYASRAIGEVFVSSIYNVPCMHVRML